MLPHHSSRFSALDSIRSSKKKVDVSLLRPLQVSSNAAHAYETPHCNTPLQKQKTSPNSVSQNDLLPGEIAAALSIDFLVVRFSSH
jgi:hypothetical protein